MSKQIIKNPSPDYSQGVFVVKHAPKKLEDFKGNAGVVQTLKSFLESGNIPNLILTGPHGTGKSLVVKLLINEYLGNLAKQGGCLEIYGSLSRGKDVVSEKQSVKNKQKNFSNDNIADFIKSASNVPKTLFRIVVIYEFHQMSAEAQTALNSIMEENSKKVRFILVTQNYDQIIQAIQSRCSILKFQKLDQDEMNEVLTEIAEEENIQTNPEMLDLIYLNCEGDISSGVNLLQILGKSDIDHIYEILGTPEIKTINQIIDLCQNQQGFKACKIMTNLLNSGFEISDLLDILTKVLIRRPYFPKKNEFLRTLCQNTFIIQECYTETQFLNLINYLAHT